MIDAEFPAPPRYDLNETLRFARFGPLDPTARRTPGSFCKAAWTPDGAVAVQVERRDRDAPIAVRAWGDGAAWTLARAERYLGLLDPATSFQPEGALGDLARRHAAVYLPRSPWPFDALYAAILQQRVTFEAAARAHRTLVRRYADDAPGPLKLKLPLTPRAIGALPDAVWRPLGVDGQRAAAIRDAARYAHRINRLFDADNDVARRTLGKLRGCGAWTVEMTMGFGLGDPDALPIGDLRLPHVVAWALAGEHRGDDRRMEELLAPLAGHRFRVIRLLFAARLDAPRRSVVGVPPWR